MSFNRFVKILSPKDFDDVEVYKLRPTGQKKRSFVLFHVEWCGYCQETKPVWNELAKMASYIDICAYNCEEYPNHIARIRSDLPKFIQSYPTLVLYDESGNPKKFYEGKRTLDNLLKFTLK